MKRFILIALAAVAPAVLSGPLLAAPNVTEIKSKTDGLHVQNPGNALIRFLIQFTKSTANTYYPMGKLYSTGTAVNTAANTTETDGASYTVPANTLGKNGDVLRFQVYGTTGATGNNKTVQIYWGGTSVFSTGAVAANAKPWNLTLTVVRTAAGAQTITVTGTFNASAITPVSTTASKDETTALVVKNTMTNGTAAATDCTTSAAIVEYLP